MMLARTARRRQCARPWEWGWSLLVAIVAVSALGSCATAPERSSAHEATRLVPVEVLNPDVTQATILQTICVAGYTASVRPSTSFTNGVKQKLLRELGLPGGRQLS